MLRLGFFVTQNLKSKDAIVFTQFAIYQSQSFKITQYASHKYAFELINWEIVPIVNLELTLFPVPVLEYSTNTTKSAGTGKEIVDHR